jgi:ribosomal protein L37AE/L43A
MTRNSVASIDAEIKALKQKRHSLRGKQIWKCPLCEKGTQIGRLDLVVIKFYVRPYSCTGGDYWTEGDKPEYKVHCPKCNRNIREINSNGRGVGFDGLRGVFSEKRWTLINTHRDAFASEKSECRD